MLVRAPLSRLVGLLAAGAAVACSGGEGAAAEVSLEARVERDDLVVAQVNGKPVFGSCVAAQVAGGLAADRAAALAQCVDFELLAQEAARRGLAADAEVHEARKREAVRRFIAAEFVTTVRSYDDLPPGFGARALAKLRETDQQPERRVAAYVRVPAPEDAPSGSPDDEWARGLAGELHAALADHADLTADRLWAIAAEVAHGRTFQVGEPFVFHRQGAEEPFAAAAFAIPAVGRVAPPTRTKLGWDVILLTAIRPKSTRTEEERKAALFPELRRGYFNHWAHQYTRGVAIDVDEEWRKRLVASDQGGP
jgi:hypothetical protein